MSEILSFKLPNTLTCENELHTVLWYQSDDGMSWDVSHIDSVNLEDAKIIDESILACPIITWETPEPIVSGTELSVRQLNAQSNIPGTFIYDPPEGTALPLGINTLDVLFISDTLYRRALSVQIEVIKLEQEILHNIDLEYTYGDGPVELNAISTSGLDVLFEVISGNGIIVGNLLTITGVGVIDIKLSQAGNLSYDSADDIYLSLNVKKAKLTIVSDNSFKNVGDVNPYLTVSYLGFVNNETINDIIGLPYPLTSCSTSSVAGNYSIILLFGTLVSVNYEYELVNGILSVGRPENTITSSIIPDFVYGDLPFTLTSTALSGGSVSYISTKPEVISIVGNQLIINNSGTTDIIEYFKGNNISGAAQNVFHNITVNKKDLYIDSGNYTKQCLEDDPEFLYTQSGLINSDAMSGFLIRDIGEDAGLYTIRKGILSAGKNYNIILENRSLAITRILAEISIPELVYVYDNTPKYAKAITSPHTFDVTFTYDGSIITPTNIGTYEVVATIDDPMYFGFAIGTMRITNLEYHPLSGTYIWSSLLVNNSRYHKLVFLDTLGATHNTTLIFPPLINLPNTNNPDIGLLINNISEIPNYTLGDSIDLIFKPDQDYMSYLGTEMTVQVLDIYGDILATLTAQRVGDIFVATYNIPINLGKKYNITKMDESLYDTSKYYLMDRWFIGNKYIDFWFTVDRVLDAIDQKNCIIEVFIDGIQAEDESSSEKSILAFTTKLEPYYSSVQEVRDINSGLLSSYDNFTVARQIINQSKIVDWHMKPNVIHHQQAYDHAVRNWVRIKTASTLLLSVSQINSEEKQLDTFRYKINSAQPKDLLEPLEEKADNFALFIYAGGHDTPFKSKSFVKGLFDPNRPNIGRADIDTRGWLPWTNSTSTATLVEIDGQTFEVRGQRSISYSYITNRYLTSDKGDVGYLSGI